MSFWGLLIHTDNLCFLSIAQSCNVLAITLSQPIYSFGGLLEGFWLLLGCDIEVIYVRLIQTKLSYHFLIQISSCLRKQGQPNLDLFGADLLIKS